jgi:DNA polymerase-3 subunit beta
MDAFMFLIYGKQGNNGMLIRISQGGLVLRVVCSKDSLLEGINTVQKAVSTRTVLPILEGILLEAEDRLKLTGNDLEMGIEYYVDADIQKNGSIVINSKMLGDIVRKMSDMEVTIEVQEDNTVIIESEDTRFKIKGLASAGFPAISQICADNTFALSQGLIKDMIKKTIFAVSTDENMNIITGSLIECKNGQLTFVSMDRARMAVCRRTNENMDTDFKVVVPGKTLNEIMKILQPVDEEVILYSTRNQIVFGMKNCKVTSRLLEGEYFNYRSMILSDYETKVFVNTKRLLLSMERAFLISSGEKRHPVMLSVYDDKMVIMCVTELGEVNDEIMADMTGSIINILFNPALFMDTLRSIDDETVELLFATNHGPCIIKPVNNDKFTYVIAGVLR